MTWRMQKTAARQHAGIYRMTNIASMDHGYPSLCIAAAALQRS
jgi:hypothetical protein